jgi:uncharacterized protein YkwD
MISKIIIIMKTILGALVPLVFVFALISCSSNYIEETVVDDGLVVDYDYNDNEIELVKLINEYRVGKGLDELVIINHISYKSAEHNEYMIRNNVVNHAFFQERSDNLIRVLGAVKVSENVAYNYNEPQLALSAWLNSSTHRGNIEGDFTNFGLSIRESPKTGKKYYTNIFVKR